MCLNFSGLARTLEGICITDLGGQLFSIAFLLVSTNPAANTLKNRSYDMLVYHHKTGIN
jgi:hypothetical protein